MQTTHRKILIAVIAAAVLAGGGYAAFAAFGKKQQPLRYVLGTVTKGTLIASVSGSGQVSASDKVDLKPKSSGDLVSLTVKEGQQVKAGTVIARIDASDAVKAVRDAQDALDTANLSLEKLKAPPEDLTLLQAQNALLQSQQSVAQAKKSAEDARTSLSQTYDDGFTDVADAFLELPAVMTGLEDLLHGTDFSQSNWNIDAYADAVKEQQPGVLGYRDDVEKKYEAARAAYESNFQQYHGVNRDTDDDVIAALITRTQDTTAILSDTIKAADNLIRYYQDAVTARGMTPKSVSDSHLSKLAGFAGTVNRHLSAMQSATRAIDNAKDAIDSADKNVDKSERDLVERQKTNDNIVAPPDALDLRSAEMTVRQREEALADARKNLGDYTIVAPFDGIISAVGAKLHDSVSSGTTVATLITQTKIAEVSLNEIDAAKVAVGQKVTMTFDAVDGLSLSGKVATVDAVGAVSQGVVSYGVTIALDADDDRVKPGMTVSAAIITDVATDVLLVPTAAIKSLGDAVTVQVPVVPPADGGASPAGVALPQGVEARTVEIGTGDGVNTEVTGGLSEGDTVVVRTVDPNVKAAAPAARTGTQSIIPGTGAGGAAGTVRFNAGGGNAAFRTGRGG